MWGTVGAGVLVAWLIIATGILLVTILRRVRANGLPSRPDPDIFPSTHGGRVPPTPPPEWASRTDGSDGTDTGARPRDGRG